MDQSIIDTANRILKNEDLSKHLATKGYSIFPFLRSEQIENLIRYYSTFQKEEPDHFYSSTHAKDFEFRKKTSNFIKETISASMPAHFKSYRLLGGAFVVKPPYGKGILQPHQDWNLVDESKSRSFNLWIPLTDVNVENGAVFVLPGSHSKIETYRGPGIPPLFKNVEVESWKDLEVLPMKAGEALFYDHALLHGSPANSSNKSRLGIVCGMILENIPVQLCFPQEDLVAIYRATEDFFLEKDPNNGPGTLTLLKKIKAPYTQLSPVEYRNLFLKEEVKKNWLQKLLTGSWTRPRSKIQGD